jgi:arabinose-5-phosphate isomerase
MDASQIAEIIREVLRWESRCLETAADRIDTSAFGALEILKGCTGRIVVTGMGKMGHVARKAAATFSSTGAPAFFLHPSEALHGDLGMVAKADVVIALSNSGETAELLELVPHLVRQGIPMIALTGRRESTLAKRSQVTLDISVAREADEISSAPTASTIVTMAMCDALAVALMRVRGFTREQFAIFHPSGHLGKKMLTTVHDVMHSGERMPVASSTISMREAIVEMSKKGLGCVIAIDDQSQVVGILTDGDLRRLLAANQNPLSETLQKHLVQRPKTVRSDLLAAEALQVMERHAITVLPVVDASQRLIGVLHLHSLVQIGLA